VSCDAKFKSNTDHVQTMTKKINLYGSNNVSMWQH